MNSFMPRLSDSELENLLLQLPAPFGYQEAATQWACGDRESPGLWDVTLPAGDKWVRIIASSKGRAVVYIDPGLGKSRIGIEVYRRLCNYERVIVACSKKALNTWRREFPKWHPGISLDNMVIVEGTPIQRAKLWKLLETDQTKRIFVVTFQSGQIDYNNGLWSEADFMMCIADECKLWRKRSTQSFAGAPEKKDKSGKVTKKRKIGWASVLHKIPFVLPMDGTLVKDGPQDLWTFLNIIKPKTYTSFWKYAGAFCNIIDGPFGKEFVGPKNTQALGQLMSHTVLRIRDNDPAVEGVRPPLTRDLIPIEMTKEQKRLYDAFTNEMFVQLESGEIQAAPSQLAVQAKHRSILICPKLIDPAYGYGAAFEHFLMELEDDPHQVLFTPYKRALPFFIQGIKDAGFETPYILSGGTPSEEVGRVETGFNGSAGSGRSCIVTVKFAESFELYTAKQCRFIGYEWSQLENYQAEKRLHRAITPHPVNSYYYAYDDSVDHDVLAVLNNNQRNVNLTFQDYISALRKTRQ